MSISSNPPKALLFDVFGTCTDWQTSVPRYLALRAKQSNPSTASSQSQSTWSSIAHEWRAAYTHFVRSYQPGTTIWQDIDSFHRNALEELLRKHDLAELWTPAELDSISRVWHSLDGWPDAGPGIRALNALGLKTASLSNGNMSLLEDLSVHADLPFTKILSAENARTDDGEHAYKPHPAVYRYGAAQMGYRLDECAMVAAHIGELKVAKGLGMKVVYVERRNEEAWSQGDLEEARSQGWVDVWVDGRQEGEGFLEVAKRLQGNM